MIELRWKKQKLSDPLLSYYAPPVLQYRHAAIGVDFLGYTVNSEWQDVPEVDE
jgi:hypothetical protein